LRSSRLSHFDRKYGQSDAPGNKYRANNCQFSSYDHTLLSFEVGCSDGGTDYQRILRISVTLLLPSGLIFVSTIIALPLGLSAMSADILCSARAANGFRCASTSGLGIGP